MVVQPDGKPVVVGYQSDSYPDGNDFLVMRYNTNGTLDTSFSGDGIQVTDFSGFYDGASAVALQPDGKIVVGGHASTATGTSDTDHAVARYNADGSLDTSFGVGGKVTIDQAGNSEQALAVTVDASACSPANQVTARSAEAWASSEPSTSWRYCGM